MESVRSMYNLSLSARTKFWLKFWFFIRDMRCLWLWSALKSVCSRARMPKGCWNFSEDKL